MGGAKGTELLTPTLPVWCATSCAIAPYSVVTPGFLSAFESYTTIDGRLMSRSPA